MRYLLLLPAILLAAPVAAQTPTDAPPAPAAPIDSASMRAARGLLVAMHADQVFITTVERSLATAAANGPTQLPPKFMERFLAAVRAELPNLLEQMAQVYARNYTKSEIEAFTAFFKTPTGQAMVAKQGIITAESSEMGQRWGSALAMRVMGEMIQSGEMKPPGQ
jgi:hypothetical protein